MDVASPLPSLLAAPASTIVSPHEHQHAAAAAASLGAPSSQGAASPQLQPSSASLQSLHTPLRLLSVPPQIVLPFLDRPAELAALIAHNRPFFTLLEHSIGDAVFTMQLMPLLCEPREELDDIEFMRRVRKLLCGASDSSSLMWAEFCRIVGADFLIALPPASSVPQSPATTQGRISPRACDTIMEED
ncbi:uncharacterized protein V1518DRAFT_428476 [Limtongia smithiae]|uniref:uncharacterized protein n=1 Tax=Limtongia smithiae TaxID=1125753 RepID=UPI0034CE52BE